MSPCRVYFPLTLNSRPAHPYWDILCTYLPRLELGIAVVSTGGTAKALRAAGVTVIDVADVTKFEEMLGKSRSQQQSCMQPAATFKLVAHDCPPLAVTISTNRA